jgi:ATP-dependent helicase HrpB
MKQHPTIASGRLRLRIEFLAPNQRPIQITDNLERFWTDSYPQIKRELAGRYPKHDWR